MSRRLLINTRRDSDLLLSSNDAELLARRIVANWPKGWSSKVHQQKVELIASAITEAVRLEQEKVRAISDTLTYYCTKLRELEQSAKFAGRGESAESELNKADTSSLGDGVGTPPLKQMNGLQT